MSETSLNLSVSVDEKDIAQEVAQVKALIDSELFKGLPEAFRNFILDGLNGPLLQLAISCESATPCTGNLVVRLRVFRLVELITAAFRTFNSDAVVTGTHESSLNVGENFKRSKGIES